MTFATAIQHGLLLGCCAIVVACSDGSLSEQIGLERKPPDEFRVLARPPLNVPPEFSLRPPTTEEEAAGLNRPASKEAEALVLGTENVSSTAGLQPGSASTAVQPVLESPLGSQADVSFLTRAGVNAADPEIRETLRKEGGYYEDPSQKDFIDRLREKNKDEPTVDAVKEKERLQQNKAEDKPLNDGETPVIKPKDRGVIGNIF